MYCRNCGNKLQDGDKFCSNCGTKIEAKREKPEFFVEDEPLNEEKNQKVEDKPKFFTENVADKEEDQPKRVFKREKFDWNLEGFPDTENKKTDDIDFNWGSVLDEKTSYREDSRVPLFSEENEEPLEDFLFKNEALKKEADSGDAPNKDSAEPVDKFYTFNKKNEEFQQLLDREYEKLKKRGFEPTSEEEALDEQILTMDVSPEDKEYKMFEEPKSDEDEIPLNYIPAQGEECVEILDDKNDRSEAIEDEVTVEGGADEKEVVDIRQPLDSPPIRDNLQEKSSEDGDEKIGATVGREELPAESSGSIINENQISDSKSNAEPNYISKSGEEAEEAESPKHSERYESFDSRFAAYGDIFNDQDDEEKNKKKRMSFKERREAKKAEQAKLLAQAKAINEVQRESIESSENSDIDTFKPEKTSKDSDNNKSPKKKSPAITVLKVIFYLIMVLVLVALGFKYFAKDSIVTQKIDEGYNYAICKLTGKCDAIPKEEPVSNIDTWISDGLKEKNETIENVIPNKELKFIGDKNYGFDDLKNSKEFSNSIWYTSDDGKDIYYGNQIVNSVIQYYSNYAKDKDEGFKIRTLEIGEIRTGDFGFYNLVKVMELDGNGVEKTYTQTVYMEPIGKEMKVSDVKTFEEGE